MTPLCPSWDTLSQPDLKHLIAEPKGNAPLTFTLTTYCSTTELRLHWGACFHTPLGEVVGVHWAHDLLTTTQGFIQYIQIYYNWGGLTVFPWSPKCHEQGDGREPSTSTPVGGRIAVCYPCLCPGNACVVAPGLIRFNHKIKSNLNTEVSLWPAR